MEWNLNAPSEWDWEVEMPKSLPFSSNENGDYSFSIGFSDMVEESSVLSGEAVIGLKLGRQTYCQDKTVTTSFPLVPASSCSPIKRSRVSHQSSQSPRCQVEGCNLDLASAKDYHRRHRICADHSKSPKVVVSGMERRFCQQCSRFHDLSEFDDRKRSCRRRLSAHNARRRRPQSEEIQFSSTNRRTHMSFLVNRVSIPVPRSAPKSSLDFKCRGADVVPHGAVSNTSSIFHGVPPRNANHNGLEASSNSIFASQVRRTFSPQTSSWGLNGPQEPSSFDQFVHGHANMAQLGMPLELQNMGDTQLPTHNFECFSSN